MFFDMNTRGIVTAEGTLYNDVIIDLMGGRWELTNKESTIDFYSGYRYILCNVYFTMDTFPENGELHCCFCVTLNKYNKISNVGIVDVSSKDATTGKSLVVFVGSFNGISKQVENKLNIKIQSEINKFI